MAASPTDERDSERGYYVYGIVPADVHPPLEDVPAVDPRFPVQLLHCEGLGVLVSEVSPAAFEGETLQRSLNDATWLEERVRAHEAVLERALADGTVVPLRFGTIYRSRESLRDYLARERERLTSLVTRLRGKREWGVKCFLDPARLAGWIEASDEHAARLRAALRGQPEGGAYFGRKKLERYVRERGDEIASGHAGAAHARLAEEAEAATLTQSPLATAPEGRRLLFNGAYLVDEHREGPFRAAIAALAAEHEPLGLSFELTGPWPAYNFVPTGTDGG